MNESGIRPLSSFCITCIWFGCFVVPFFVGTAQPHQKTNSGDIVLSDTLETNFAFKYTYGASVVYDATGEYKGCFENMYNMFTGGTFTFDEVIPALDIELYFPKEELLKIRNKVIEIGFFDSDFKDTSFYCSYRDRNPPVDDIDYFFSSTYKYIYNFGLFVRIGPRSVGRRWQIDYCSPPEPPGYQGLRTLVAFIDSIIQSRWEFQTLPRPSRACP